MKKIFNFVKNFLNFVKNNALLIFAAFFLLDFILGIFYIPTPADPIERKIKCINLAIDILWVFGFLEVYFTIKTEKHLYKCIKLVDDKVDLIYDFLQKTIEEEKSEEESSDKEAEDKKEVK